MRTVVNDEKVLPVNSSDNTVISGAGEQFRFRPNDLKADA